MSRLFFAACDQYRQKKLCQQLVRSIPFLAVRCVIYAVACDFVLYVIATCVNYLFEGMNFQCSIGNICTHLDFFSLPVRNKHSERLIAVILIRGRCNCQTIMFLAVSPLVIALFNKCSNCSLVCELITRITSFVTYLTHFVSTHVVWTNM